MERSESTGVLVVGGGLAGLSVAAELGGPGLAVLERLPQMGGGASADNAGMVRRLGEDPYERALALRTHARLVDLDAEPDFPAGCSRQTGALLGLVEELEHLHDGVAHLREAGVPVEWTRGAALEARAPLLAGSPLKGGWWLPEARVAEAAGLVDGLRRRALRRGATLHNNVEVIDLDVAAGRVAGLWVDAGAGPARIASEAVVLAAGAWCAGLAQRAGLDRRLIPLRRSLLLSSGGPPAPPEHPWVWIDDLGVYARPESGTWLVSPCDEAVGWPDGERGRGEASALAMAMAAEKVSRWFPALGRPAWRQGWTGLRTFAPDRRPMLGPDPALPGLHWCAGLGGFGVSCGLAAGEAVAAWLRGETVPWLDPSGVRADRRTLSRWPIRPSGELTRARLIDGKLDPPPRRPLSP